MKHIKHIKEKWDYNRYRLDFSDVEVSEIEAILNIARDKDMIVDSESLHREMTIYNREYYIKIHRKGYNSINHEWEGERNSFLEWRTTTEDIISRLEAICTVIPKDTNTCQDIEHVKAIKHRSGIPHSSTFHICTMKMELKRLPVIT
jgi:hypothetical protein